MNYCQFIIEQNRQKGVMLSMKIILYTFFMFSVQLVMAQELKSVIYEKHWAGGMCCRSGVDYTLEFYFPISEMTPLDSVKIDSPTLKIMIPVHKMEFAKYHDFIRYTYTCGYSNNRIESINENEQYYNMTTENRNGSKDLSISYYCSGNTFEIKNATLNHQIIAYP